MSGTLKLKFRGFGESSCKFFYYADIPAPEERLNFRLYSLLSLFVGGAKVFLWAEWFSFVKRNRLKKLCGFFILCTIVDGSWGNLGADFTHFRHHVWNSFIGYKWDRIGLILLIFGIMKNYYKNKMIKKF